MSDESVDQAVAPTVGEVLVASSGQLSYGSRAGSGRRPERARAARRVGGPSPRNWGAEPDDAGR
ncbi:hypothetical protein ACWC4D_36115 [Streptomyces sp. NPDC001288]|uniref:hypothetical protein n=1 Tax=Streptomyces sp. NPDC001297 TaxID=3364559 RepID=UPI0036BED980